MIPEGRSAFWTVVVPPLPLRNRRTTTTMNKKQLEALRGDFSADSPSSDVFVSTLSEWYDAKHRKPSAEEISFLNSLVPADCPLCGSASVARKGKQAGSGMQRWVCKRCRSRFSPIAGTIFDSKKIPISEWIEYLIHLFEYHSVTTAASDNRNAGTTGRYWLNKVFLVLSDYQDGIRLSGDVWIDEAFAPVWPSEAEGAGGKLLRGLSRNQCAIAGGTDKGKCFLLAMGAGKPSAKGSAKAYCPHIAEGSSLIHDGEKSHDAVVSLLSLGSTVYKADETKGLADDENPMEPINKVHRYLKGFLRAHRGYSRDDLQNWLNLFCFMWNEKGSAAKKAQAFIELAVRKRVILRYRDWKNSK